MNLAGRKNGWSGYGSRDRRQVTPSSEGGPIDALPSERFRAVETSQRAIWFRRETAENEHVVIEARDSRQQAPA
jgi:hypothetical protein